MRLLTENLSWQELDGEIVVLDLGGSAYFRVNGSGALLWRKLADGENRPDLEQVLVDTYGLPSEQAASDVDTFLADVRSHGLLSD